MQHIFREYDIRGVFEKDLNEKTVKLIGYFLGKKIKEHGDYAVVTYDARTHSPILSDWLVSGLNAANVVVLHGGLVPTPVNYFCNFNTFQVGGKQVMPAGGIQITGSHNPPEYNGFKITINQEPFFGEDIYALGREVEKADIAIPTETDSIAISALDAYIDYLAKEFSSLQDFDPNMVIDCGNGAAGIAIEPLLERLGISASKLYFDPDGTFPNHHPDPSEEKNLEDLKKELERGAKYGFAFDGDGDRIAFLSQKYNFKGDILALFFAKTMDNPTVIGEVKCSQIMYDEINKIGKSIMYKTGHSNLKVKLKETGADLAAEVSGHIFFNDRYFGYDDAIYAMMRILEMLKNGFDFDAEYEKLPVLYSTDEIKIEATDESKFTIIEALKNILNKRYSELKIKEIVTIDGVRVIFEDGWGLVRASNTTPILVTRFEAKSPESLERIQTLMNDLIEDAKAKL
ncbi:phosphomannomutase/phosphoglucomutase [Hydrogenimonas thermophila]|uniref:Phosphomannomutase / phosphoglucomutase n=1 Tax=Hydrogenimonas thermophila TaxID=223786 RepID=A0A1I5PM52_9BACT|nr:phosphomannomutase/phosphoglucomutase [Hydrogenimonas thermophila]WOE71111.1 phosphomannomutase/phosphoglucomutase [Hydrogenimonas thermophila]WOE73629.1 phosphomannomutase/phosphoglucomutase [Hydrogenimonas thermophila]SFP35134.1 phosphomannomutase / phosphoglucomutase [Hydrogenimonas thermophila]